MSGINWDEIPKLRVISKLEEIVKKWYSVELIWADSSNKIKQPNCKNNNWNNLFLKSQMSLDFGHNILTQNINKVSEQFSNGESFAIFPGFRINF